MHAVAARHGIAGTVDMCPVVSAQSAALGVTLQQCQPCSSSSNGMQLQPDVTGTVDVCPAASVRKRGVRWYCSTVSRWQRRGQRRRHCGRLPRRTVFTAAVRVGGSGSGSSGVMPPRAPLFWGVGIAVTFRLSSHAAVGTGGKSCQIASCVRAPVVDPGRLRMYLWPWQ